MDDIKYLGVQGLEELIALTKNSLANKIDIEQFKDLEKDTICHYKGQTVAKDLPIADKNNYCDIYRITDASSFGPPNTHVICGTVEGDGSIYEWRSLCGNIDYFRGLHDPDWGKSEYVNFDLIAGSSVITSYTCTKRGIIIGSYTLPHSVNDSLPFVKITKDTNHQTIYGSPTVCNFTFPVNIGDIVNFYAPLSENGSTPGLARWSVNFVPYKVQ